MKVLFPLVKAGSGSDIFTYNLISGLKQTSVQADIQYLPGWSGYLPSVMGRLTDSAGYDIIHGNSWNGYAFTDKKPLVVTEHLLVHDPLYNPYKTISQKMYHSFIYQCELKSFSKACVIVSISKYVQQKIEEFFGYSDTPLIYNGIDEKKFRPVSVDKEIIFEKFSIKSGKTVLFFSGNPTTRKGGDLLPKIMNELGDKYVLICTTGLRGGGQHASDQIIPLGKTSINELIELYNVSDIFLFPTRLEGFGLSVAEAMACGKPVVTTNCSSLPELVTDGKGGYLCEMDDVKGFADAVRTLAEDSTLRKEFGQYNRNKVEKKFTIKIMADNYCKVYQKI